MEVLAYAHVGIRVRDRARSLAFYEKLGFSPVNAGDGGDEDDDDEDDDPVVVLTNRHGVEINLIVNANAGQGRNVLMDGDEKFPGHTHIALMVGPMTDVVAWLGDLGIPISGGPLWLGGFESCFIRDPDLNVIELRSNHH